MGYELQWHILWDLPYRIWIIRAICMTIGISVISYFFALVLGTLAGLLREHPSRSLRAISTAFVEIHRNIPLLVQLFFWYFALPTMFPRYITKLIYEVGWEIGCSIIVLSLYMSARVAEDVRAGLKTVGEEVKACALSTGLSWWQAQRYVVAPYLLRVIIPSLTSEFITIFKGSSLAMTVGLFETTYVTQKLGFTSFRWVEGNTLGIMVYLGCAWSVAAVMGFIEGRVRIPGLIKRGDAVR